MRYVVAAVAAVIAAWFLRLSWNGSQERIPFRAMSGLRLPSLVADPAAWRRGHVAAAGPLGVAGGAMVLGALAVAILGIGNAAGWIAVGLVVVAALVGGVWGVRAAVRAVVNPAP